MGRTTQASRALAQPGEESAHTVREATVTRSIALVTLVVRDYAEALAFPKDRSAALHGARRHPFGRWQALGGSCAAPEQAAHVGDQTGGRVALFLHTDDFWDDYRCMQAHGVRFAEAPWKERYGRVVVFYDLYGNKWDLGAAKRGMTPALAHGGTVTEIVIRPLTVTNQADLNRCDNSFTVQAELTLAATDGRISYTVRPVAPYIKHYAPGVYDAQAYTLAHTPTGAVQGVEKPDRAAWRAYADGTFAGQILIYENWNRFALIWDIAGVSAAG
jgi:hypothetical protein